MTFEVYIKSGRSWLYKDTISGENGLAVARRARKRYRRNRIGIRRVHADVPIIGYLFKGRIP